MFRRILLAALLALAPTAALGQDGAYHPGSPVTDINPPPSKCVVWTGTAYIACGRADAGGAWVHAPASTPVTGGGTIATSGGTAALVFTNTTDGEVINPSAATLWASWGTPTVNGANSFPILTGGSYRPPNRVAGTLTLLSTAVNQTYTFNKF